MNTSKRKTILSIVLWTARVWGSLSLAFLLFFVGAHIIGSLTGGGDGIGGFNSTSELVSFLFFPVCTIIGLGLAWKWEGWGGLITTGGIIGFHIITPGILFNLMINGLAAPGLLFLIYWFLARYKKKNEIIN